MESMLAANPKQKDFNTVYLSICLLIASHIILQYTLSCTLHAFLILYSPNLKDPVNAETEMSRSGDFFVSLACMNK